MLKCDHEKHSKTERVVYFVSFGAICLHMLSHLIPLLIVFNPAWVERVSESPFLTVTALMFLPLAVYHLWRDKKIHKETHRLKEVERKYYVLVQERDRLKNQRLNAKKRHRVTYAEYKGNSGTAEVEVK